MDKRLGLVVAKGLFLSRARIQGSLAILFMTDYTNTTKVVLNPAEKMIVSNPDGVNLSPEDIEKILVALAKEESPKKEEVKKV